MYNIFHDITSPPDCQHSPAVDKICTVINRLVYNAAFHPPWLLLLRCDSERTTVLLWSLSCQPLSPKHVWRVWFGTFEMRPAEVELAVKGKCVGHRMPFVHAQPGYFYFQYQTCSKMWSFLDCVNWPVSKRKLWCRSTANKSNTICKGIRLQCPKGGASYKWRGTSKISIYYVAAKSTKS